jgi:hypothetical protein
MSHEISSGAPLFFSTDSLGLEDYELPSNDTIIKNGFGIDWRVAQNILEPRFPGAFEIMKKMGFTHNAISYHDLARKHSNSKNYTKSN